MVSGGLPSDPEPGVPPEVALWALAGLVGWPLLAWGLVARFSTPVPDALLLAALVELFPALAIAQVPLVERFGIERASAYLASGVTVSVLGALAALLGVHRFGMVGMGLGPSSLPSLVMWAFGVSLAAGGLTLLLHLIRRRLEIAESPALRDLLPRTGEERRAFALLALAAGVGEELAFRGYAIPALAPHLGGPWEAAAFTSATFGLLHAYQGALGMMRTAMLGFLLAGSFVLSGSLWPAMVAHVLLDLTAGLLVGEELTR
jgi:membrane protease YdiL (CAAX protease family)